jgi:hypothetical protein
MDDDEPRKLTSPEPTLRTSSEPDWDAWNKWCDSRVDAKLISERKRERARTRAIMAEVLAQLIAKEKKTATRSNAGKRSKRTARAKR